MLTTALKDKRVVAQQKIVDSLATRLETHKQGLADAQQSLKLATAELAYRKSAPVFDPADDGKTVVIPNPGDKVAASPSPADVSVVTSGNAATVDDAEPAF